MKTSQLQWWVVCALLGLFMLPTVHASARDGNAIVSIGHDSALARGERADSVVSIFGSSTSAGEVAEAVVSILGNTRVTGPIGDSAVAVLGNNYVDSKVGDSVVAVLGNVELGPNAVIGGDVVVVGGTLTRDPAARVLGTVHRVELPISVGGFGWLHPWIEHCLLLGRPLALAPGLNWAWALALGALAFYILLALLFHRGIDRCVLTLETEPGRTCLASALSVLLMPVLVVLLFITVIGIAVIPIFVMALLVARVFGTVVVLTWIGRRLTGIRTGSNPLQAVLPVLVGGALVLLMYLIPLVGFVVFKLLGILGMGVVLYTLILSWRTDQQQQSPAAAPAPGASAAATATAATAAMASATAPPTPQVEPSVAAPLQNTSAERAGFWQRMAALLLDAVLICFVTGLIHQSDRLELIALAAYGAVMWKLKGTTIGGILFGLQVIRVDGRPIDWATAIVRALGCFLSLVAVGLGFIWIAFDPERQAWHDKIAGTVVVRSHKGASLV